MKRQVSVAWSEIGYGVSMGPAVPAARRARGLNAQGVRPVSRERARQFFSELHAVVERAPGVGKVFHG